MKSFQKIMVLFSLLVFFSTIINARSTTLDSALKSGEGRYLLDDCTISFDKIPDSVDEFISLRDKIGKDPRGGYALLVIAMIKYSRDRSMGMKFLTISMDRNKITKSNSDSNYKGFLPSRSSMFSIKMMHTRPYLGHVYISGTSYENGYKLPSPPYVIRFNQVTVLPKGELKLFAFTTSGNLPRPVALRKNNRGIWKAYEFSSVFTGISRLPKKEVIDDDL